MIKYYEKHFSLEEYRNTDILWSTSNLLTESVPNVSGQSLVFFQNNNQESKRLMAAIKFVEENIEGHSDILGLSFVYDEVQALFFRSFYLASSGFYKEAIFNLRSALELSLFYSSEFSDNEAVTDIEEFLKHFTERRKKISTWLSSERHTPAKKRILQKLPKAEVDRRGTRQD